MEQDRKQSQHVKRAVMIGHISEEFLQQGKLDSEKAQQYIAELTAGIKSSFADYKIERLKLQDMAISLAIKLPNNWIDFGQVRGFVPEEHLHEQSIAEKITALAIHFGQSKELVDMNDQRGSCITTYTCGNFSVRFISKSRHGYMALLGETPLVSVMFEQNQKS